ncbi:MAG: hypothetical protein FJX35_09645 [Alphaproteobacteria bacterium]|nr:hypothetical protein [Alphaproteobacteria bacterium]
MNPDEPSADIVRAGLTFSWRYSHGLGALAPFFAALTQGRALATQCPSCRTTWFPPRMTCPDHGPLAQWRELAGVGTVMTVTRTTLSLPLTGRGAAAVMALIAMDGASNLVVGRIAGAMDAEPGARVRLAVDAGATVHPIQSMVFEIVGGR